MDNKLNSPDITTSGTANKTGFFRKIYNWWNKAANTPDSHPVIEVAAPSSQDDNINKPYENFEKNLKHFDDELVIPELQEKFMAHKKYMLESGQRDGILGINSDKINIIAETNAQNLFDQANVKLSGKLAAMKAELESKERIKDRDELNDRAQHEYFRYMQHGYRYFPRSFSRLLFLFYFITFIILFVADIPLALRLIIYGFNLKSDGRLSELFVGNTLEIIKSNWEVFVTSIGIASCSVYIKIFYDEYIGTPYGNKLITKMKYIDLYKQKISEHAENIQEKDWQTIDKETSNKSRWKYGVLIFTIVAILALAYFRIHTLSFIKINAVGEPMLTEQPRGVPLNLAIIAITLIFPVISGICLSLALTNRQNYLRFEEAKKDCTQSNTVFINSLMAFTDLKKKSDDLQAEHENWKNDSQRVKNYAGILLAHYEYGRNIGIAEPDKFMKEKDFYEKVELWREKIISKKINNQVIN